MDSAAWAVAFHRQATSDWAAMELLMDAPLARCHWLHYLQMAAEKTAKAHALGQRGASVERVIRHHTGVDKFVRAFILGPVYNRVYRGRDAQRDVDLRRMVRVALMVQALAPAVDAVQSPRNVEYPWLRADRVVAPSDEAFSEFDPNSSRDLQAFMRLIQRALDTFQPAP